MLFTETHTRNNTFANRLVRSATNDHLSNMDGTVSDEQTALYEEMAKAGTGLIITGHFAVSERYKTAVNQPLLSDDRFIAGAAGLSDAVHRHGGMIYAQISHGGLKALEPLDINEAAENELDEIACEFADAAVRVQKAGYDGVQIHLAHGYFLANVLDDSVNLRNDEYGGSSEGRFRLVRRIIEETRRRVGRDYDIAVKISGGNMKGTYYDDTLKYYAEELEKCGTDIIEVSGTDFNIRKPADCEYYTREALLVKENVGIPVIVTGGMSSLESAESALASGLDMVGLARAFICEPDFARKLREGEKSKCLRCNQCYKLYNKTYKNCILREPEPKHRELFG